MWTENRLSLSACFSHNKIKGHVFHQNLYHYTSDDILLSLPQVVLDCNYLPWCFDDTKLKGELDL